MLPFLEVIPSTKLANASVYVEYQHLPKKPAYWHYHPELEIIYIIEGSGIRQVGDNLGDFKPGDFFIFGNNLPHDLHVEGSIDHAKLLLIQIKPELLASNYQFEELEEVMKTINLADRGILIEGFYSDAISYFLRELNMPPLQKLLTLLELFRDISQPHWQARTTQLSSINYKHKPSDNKSDMKAHDRLNTVIQFIQENYHQQIFLKDIADKTFMSPNAFSRWFKQTMNIGFLEHLNKYRIEESCRQMISTSKPLSIISQDCGFESHSSFNRCFTKYKGTSPGKYKTHVTNKLTKNELH